ncbi:MAG: Gfo/Idh/MocA family oxidoreductase [Patescibacteria group bacterium]|nr:Gfo/Idh/MocA family oxidoreductase [Patescibacteria group bacterium]
MKFSLIGTGFIMPRHAQAIIETGGEICEIINDSQSETAWKKMIETTKADCVVILTPNDLHFEMALKAVECGKVVLCEKPLAINSEDVKILEKKPNVFSVLQLRHHLIAKKLKKEIVENNKYDIEMDISVYRDENYYSGWKGMKERSGGVLFNLGSHYFDMLLYLFGDAKNIKTTLIDDKTGEGIIEGENYSCKWMVSTDAKRDNQKRVFKINGTDYNFSSQDNLSFENLHRFVYEDLLDGKGVTPSEALQSIELIERLYKNENL